MGFDPNEPRWQCCCGCMQVRTGAIVIGILGLVWSVLTLGGGLFVNPLNIIPLLVAIVLTGLLIWGAVKYNGCLMIPYIVWQIIGLAVLIVAAIVCIVFGAIAMTKGKESTEQLTDHIEEHLGSTLHPDQKEGLAKIIDMLGGALIALGGVLLVVFAIGVWLTCVLCKAYSYVKEASYAGYGAGVGPSDRDARGY